MFSIWKCALNYRIRYIKTLIDAVADLPLGTLPSTRVLHRLK